MCRLLTLFLITCSFYSVKTSHDEQYLNYYAKLRNKRQSSTCPPLSSSESEEVLCRLKGSTASCSEPLNNTIALVRCQPYHIYQSDRPVYRCQNGEWDSPFTPCVAQCGVKRESATTLISEEGEKSKIEYPWVVAIYNGSDQLICSGSIISRAYVLSAAHCFSDNYGTPNDKNEYTIVAGKYHRDLSKEEPASQIRKIKSLYLHENFEGNRLKYKNDIALVELDGELTLSPKVQPICVDWLSYFEDFDFTDGTGGIVAGWGYTQSNASADNTLKEVLVSYRSREKCVEDLPLDFVEEYLTSDKFCARYEYNETNVCQGDSGGGLYFKSDGNRHYIRGVVSIAPKFKGQCNPSEYVLYTKVSRFLPWIEGITKTSIENFSSLPT